MNRKLINGLLLLTVAMGGVGTFTSCKDNEDGLEIKKTQAKLFDILDAKIKQGDENLEVVKDKLNALAGAGLLTEENQAYLEDLIKNNEDYATTLKSYVDDMIVSMITNVQIEEVYNPAFGTLNLPFGIKNGLLCNYYYQADHPVKFPLDETTGYVYGDPEAIAAIHESGLTPVGAIERGIEVQPIDRLGEIYVTINPAGLPDKVLDGLVITMHKTNGEQVLGTLKAVKEDDHVKYFGYTRAEGNDNGFYKILVGVTADDVHKININLDDNLKAAAKDFVKSPSKSDLLGLAEAIYKQFNNKVPALGLKFEPAVTNEFTFTKTPWSKGPGGVVLPNVEVGADGKYTTVDNNVVNNPAGTKDPDQTVTWNSILRSVYSPYDIAAVTYHPLSYSFDPEGYVPDRRLPQIGHIQDIVNRVLDKVNFDFNLNADKYGIDLKDVKLKVENSSITVDLSGCPVVDANGNPTGDKLGNDAKVVLSYNNDVVGRPNDNAALNPLVDSILKAVNGDEGLISSIQTKVNETVTTMVDDINSQIKTGVVDKIADIKQSINNELNGRLGDGVNRLIDLYNAAAKKINGILDNPNAYMQVYAAYKDGNGDLHHLSTVESDPSLFAKGTGEAITLFLTSYNGELLAPAYKKYVAVVKGGDRTAAQLNANSKTLNTVFDGRGQRAYIPVENLPVGETCQVVYTALDYRGNVSARSFYIKVVE